MSNAKRIAFLLADGFEDSEMASPYDEMVRQGHNGVIISLERDQELKGKKGTVTYRSHLAARDAQGADYEAVIIPGGSSPAQLMNDPEVQRFVREADKAGITLAAICHGPQLLAAAGVLQGRTVTGYAGIAEEITRAGGTFVDREVMVDGNLITSRKPEDEPAFIDAALNRLGTNAW
jgi:protease I